MRNIFRILEKEYVHELFEKKKLIYFPELKNKKIGVIKIEKISPDWAKETCLAKYKIFFEDETYKVIRGTANVDESREKVWRIMDFLYGQGFNEGNLRVAKPLDFFEDTNLLLYEEVQGVPLSLIIQKKDAAEIEDILKRAAAWLAKIHSCNFKKENDFPPAVFVKKSGYSKMFAQIINLMPGLKSDLVLDSELEFIDEIFGEQKTLINNDFYPGNIIVSKEIIYGIDFEKSGLGAWQSDLATLCGWFEFPKEIHDLNLPEEVVENLQKKFLETYCESKKINLGEVKKDLNKFLAKIFLDQIYNYATICVKGWNYFESADKIGYEEKIRALAQKVRQCFI